MEQHEEDFENHDGPFMLMNLKNIMPRNQRMFLPLQPRKEKIL
jgi:hypothetical protein